MKLFILTFYVDIYFILSVPFPNDSQCEIMNSMLLNHLLLNSTLPIEYKDITKLLQYSGSGFNDLGDYYSCVLIPYAHYQIIQFQYKDIIQSIGLCLFKVCSLNETKSAIDSLYSKLNATFPIHFARSAIKVIDPEIELTHIRKKHYIKFIVITVILIVILLLCGISSCFKIEKISSFDVTYNIKKVFNIDNKNETFSHLRLFDFIRFISSLWIVYGHSCLFQILFGAKNTIDIKSISTKFYFCILTSAFYAVDIFFYISGFMLIFSLHRLIKQSLDLKSKFVLFSSFILNRYIRLLPFYLFVIFAITYITPYLSDGPNYFNITTLNKGCEKNSWHNLLYINNLVDYGNNAMNEMCAGHTWYLACDMQFFIIIAGIEIFFNEFTMLKTFLFIGIFVGSIIFQLVKVISENFTYWDFYHIEEGFSKKFFTDFYMKPHVRITPYLIGVFFGKMFINTIMYLNDNKCNTIDNIDTKNEILIDVRLTTSNHNFYYKINEQLTKSKILSTILLIFSFIVMTLSFITSSIGNHFSLSPLMNSFLHTFNKIFFTLSLSILLHLTFLNKFPFINKILPYKFLTPLSRVTYGIYLLHVYFISIFSTSYNTFYYINLSDLFFLSIGIFFLSAVSSLLIGLIIESPIITKIKKLKKY